MANWISSKLKVAETFLQQIDQQAADSLGKNEKPTPNELQQKNPTKNESSSPAIVPLKDQLKLKLKKRTDPHTRPSNSTPLRNNSFANDSIQTSPTTSSNPSPIPLTDTDWTQLLSTPKQSSPPPPPRVNAIRGQFRKAKTPKPNLASSKNRVNGGKANAKPSDGNESGSGSSGGSSGSPQIENVAADDEKIESFGKGVEDMKKSVIRSEAVELEKESSKVNEVIERKKQVVDDESDAVVRSSTVHDLNDGPSLLSDGTTESDSTSTSDSEEENERKAERARRRERELAEKAAARAAEVIKERENVVARLEGEKQSLEKILEERAKQQAQEASELQTSMMETMDAVDLEKQKHNHTRMEALSRLTELETANAALAKSLATTQWNLEIEVNKVAGLREHVDSKEALKDELGKRISKVHHSGSSSNKLEASRGVEFEREILEAEYSFTCDKIRELQEKAKKLEESMEITRKEMEDPTEVEVELKRRLGQLTDHLIQKQAQVEALSSEKATLLFRIEGVSKILEEHKSIPQLSDMASSSSREDLEMGTWGLSYSKFKPSSFADRVRYGGQHFGSVIWQLDAIFSAGAAFLRRNSSAKFSSVVYLVCLHFWVLYILTSHSEVPDTRSGAVVSLESINKTMATS